VNASCDCKQNSISAAEPPWVRRRCNIAATSLQHRCNIAATSLQHRCNIAATSLQHRYNCNVLQQRALLDARSARTWHDDPMPAQRGAAQRSAARVHTCIFMTPPMRAESVCHFCTKQQHKTGYQRAAGTGEYSA
jgi:hypothetical protein